MSIILDIAKDITDGTTSVRIRLEGPILELNMEEILALKQQLEWITNRLAQPRYQKS